MKEIVDVMPDTLRRMAYIYVLAVSLFPLSGQDNQSFHGGQGSGPWRCIPQLRPFRM